MSATEKAINRHFFWQARAKQGRIKEQQTETYRNEREKMREINTLNKLTEKAFCLILF